jgi:hypothetical protein
MADDDPKNGGQSPLDEMLRTMDQFEDNLGGRAQPFPDSNGSPTYH